MEILSEHQRDENVATVQISTLLTDWKKDCSAIKSIQHNRLKMTATARPAAKKQEENHSAPTSDNNHDHVPLHASAMVSKSPKGKERKPAPPATALEIAALISLILLTYFLMPHPLHPEGEPTIHHVFYYGWLTAISTGLGVVPLIFAPNLASYWVGVSNGTDNGFLSFVL